MLDSLTLFQMRVFVTVAETGSFSGTARRFDRVQSAISQSIKTMEASLRLELFERTGRTPVLTPAGMALLREARDILGDVESLKKRAETLRRGLPPRLDLAVDQVFPSELLMEGLRSFRETFTRSRHAFHRGAWSHRVEAPQQPRASCHLFTCCPKPAT